MATSPGYRRSSRFRDPRFRRSFARLVTHYWSHAASLADGRIYRQMHRLDRIAGMLIHGRLDLISPAHLAESIHDSSPASDLTILHDSGQGPHSPPAKPRT